jgi:hypothetical protein
VILHTRVILTSYACEYGTLECNNDKHECDYDTHDCDFKTYKSDFYTQSVILTRMIRFLKKISFGLLKNNVLFWYKDFFFFMQALVKALVPCARNFKTFKKTNLFEVEVLKTQGDAVNLNTMQIALKNKVFLLILYLLVKTI